jgi:hypothetical protein
MFVQQLKQDHLQPMRHQQLFRLPFLEIAFDLSGLDSDS